MGIFPSCKDPALTAFKEIGYNVVQLPRVDLLPTNLLVARNKRLQRLGELQSVFVPEPDGATVPAIKPDKPGPDISGTKSADLDVGIGLNILGGLISALGGSTLGINLAYSNARSIQFEFSNTFENSSELALIDAFLGSSTVNQYAHAVKEMLDNDSVYVVTATLKANKINVVAKDSNKDSIGVDVPTISNAIGGNLKVSASGEGDRMLTFEGAIPLVFGFQAVQLIFDKASYRTMRLVDAGKVVAEVAEVAEGVEDGPMFIDPELSLSV